MNYELLWSMNPNLTPEGIEELKLLQQDGRDKCNAIIDRAKATMTDEELAIFLPQAMQVMAWM